MRVAGVEVGNFYGELGAIGGLRPASRMTAASVITLLYSFRAGFATYSDATTYWPDPPRFRQTNLDEGRMLAERQIVAHRHARRSRG